MRTFLLTFNATLYVQPAHLLVGDDSGLRNVRVSLLHKNCDVDKTTGLAAVAVKATEPASVTVVSETKD